MTLRTLTRVTARWLTRARRRRVVFPQFFSICLWEDAGTTQDRAKTIAISMIGGGCSASASPS
jgi:hypothetical protein